MTHRIKPGDRYKLEPTGPTYENTLPHDIIVDRQPIFVGGRVEGDPIDLLEKRTSPFLKPTIEVVFDTGGRFPGLFSDAARKRMDDAINAAILGKSALWPSPKKESPFPAFVAPERPAEPEAPKPEPDTPAVATLKALLADRQREVGRRKATVDDDRMRAEALEEELVEARKDLAHSETVLKVAEDQVKFIIADIEKLGGTVEAQS